MALKPILMKCFKKLVLKHIKDNIPSPVCIQIHRGCHLQCPTLENNNTYIRMLLVDFSTAFNTIWWNWLKHLGLSITFRNTGVPQVSVFSPLLIMLYIQHHNPKHRENSSLRTTPPSLARFQTMRVYIGLHREQPTATTSRSWCEAGEQF